MAEITIYIDGQCPLCVAGGRRLRAVDTRRRVEFVDLNDPKAQLRLPERLRTVHPGEAMLAELPNGTYRAGYFAWAEVLRRIPVLKPIGIAMLCPVFYCIGPRFYSFVANHRQEISRVLRLPPPCSDDGACRIASAPGAIAAL